MAAELAMLNTRMDRSLREKGNATLSEYGVTPSQFVRGAWQKLAGEKQEAQKLVRMVMASERTPQQQAEHDRRVAAAERGSRIFLEFAERAGLDPSTHVPLSDDKDSLAEARYEHLAEKYGW